MCVHKNHTKCFCSGKTPEVKISGKEPTYVQTRQKVCLLSKVSEIFMSFWCLIFLRLKERGEEMESEKWLQELLNKFRERLGEEYQVTKVR